MSEDRLVPHRVVEVPLTRYTRQYVIPRDATIAELTAARVQRELVQALAKAHQVMTAPPKVWVDAWARIVAAEGPATEAGELPVAEVIDPHRAAVRGAVLGRPRCASQTWVGLAASAGVALVACELHEAHLELHRGSHVERLESVVVTWHDEDALQPPRAG